MLRELIQLWPSGPSISLGDYFVAFKYVFSLAWLSFALAILVRPHRLLLVLGPFLLLFMSYCALDRPLGRPYGAVEGERALAELGDASIVVAQLNVDEGREVGTKNQVPGLGILLGVLSGFDEGRVLERRSVLPVLVLILLALASVSVFFGAEEADSKLPAGSLSMITILIALFLGSSRLSFLAAGGAFWPSYVWAAPHVGAALAAAVFGMRLLSGRSLWSLAGAALAIAAASWLELRIGLLCLLASSGWILTGGRSTDVGDGVSRWLRFCALALSGAAVLAFHPGLPTVVVAETMGTWYDAVNRILSITLDVGPLFVLAIWGGLELVRSGSALGRLLVFHASLALFLFALGASSAGGARVVDPRAMDATARFLVALTASFGLFRWLEWWNERLPDLLQSADWAPKWSQLQARRGLVLPAFVVLTLPWSFPYWWEPIRMDPVYVASIPAVSRQHLSVGETIRDSMPADARFLAGPSYAPWISALSGRNVLLDETSPVPVSDAASRRRAAREILTSQDAQRTARAVQEWGITHVLWGRLDQPDSEGAAETSWLDGQAVDFSYFDRSPSFEERFRLRRFARIYEYVGRR